MKPRALIVLSMVALSLMFAGLTLANNGIQRPRWVLGSGATDATGGNRIVIHGTLGQPMVGTVANVGEAVSLGQGFWYSAKLGYTLYMPLVIRKVQP